MCHDGIRIALMSVRSARPAPKSAPSRGTLHGPAITFVRDLAPAPIGALEKEIPTPITKRDFPRGGMLVQATAKFNEIPSAINTALGRMLASKPNFPRHQNVGDISLRSEDVQFYISIIIEQGGEKVIVNGNVGGEHFTQKFWHAPNNRIALLAFELFNKAGGDENKSVAIEYIVRN